MPITHIALECDNIAFFEELQSIIARVSSPSHAKEKVKLNRTAEFTQEIGICFIYYNMRYLFLQ